MIEIIKLKKKQPSKLAKIGKIPSILKIYHPGCGHCTALEPTWNNLEKSLVNKYSSMGNVMLGDLHFETVQDHPIDKLRNISGYPTIIGISGNKIQEYSGDRSLNDLENFCVNFLNLRKKYFKYGGSKSKRQIKMRRRMRTKRRTKKMKYKNRNTRRRYY